MAGCSTAVVMISWRSGCAFNAERIAVESDSVPQEVKMISESCSRAEQLLRPASAPS